MKSPRVPSGSEPSMARNEGDIYSSGDHAAWSPNLWVSHADGTASAMWLVGERKN